MVVGGGDAVEVGGRCGWWWLRRKLYDVHEMFLANAAHTAQHKDRMV